MEIEIKRIGFTRGTVGWLAAGLESGALWITEGTLESNGNHGLWLKGPDGFSQFLAAQNQDGLRAYEYSGAQFYKPTYGKDRDAIFTDACWAVLMAIAGKWCEECNALRDADEEAAFTLRRVDVERMPA